MECYVGSFIGISIYKPCAGQAKEDPPAAAAVVPSEEALDGPVVQSTDQPSRIQTATDYFANDAGQMIAERFGFGSDLGQLTVGLGYLRLNPLAAGLDPTSAGFLTVGTGTNYPLVFERTNTTLRFFWQATLGLFTMPKAWLKLNVSMGLAFRQEIGGVSLNVVPGYISTAGVYASPGAIADLPRFNQGLSLGFFHDSLMAYVDLQHVISPNSALDWVSVDHIGLQFEQLRYGLRYAGSLSETVNARVAAQGIYSRLFGQVEIEFGFDVIAGQNYGLGFNFSYSFQRFIPEMYVDDVHRFQGGFSFAWRGRDQRLHGAMRASVEFSNEQVIPASRITTVDSDDAELRDQVLATPDLADLAHNAAAAGEEAVVSLAQFLGSQVRRNYDHNTMAHRSSAANHALGSRGPQESYYWIRMAFYQSQILLDVDGAGGATLEISDEIIEALVCTNDGYLLAGFFEQAGYEALSVQIWGHSIGRVGSLGLLVDYGTAYYYNVGAPLALVFNDYVAHDPEFAPLRVVDFYDVDQGYLGSVPLPMANFSDHAMTGTTPEGEINALLGVE